MDQLLKDVCRISLFDSQFQNQEMGQFLNMVHRLSDLMAECETVSDLCRGVVRTIIEETDFANSSILLWDPSSRLLKLVAAFGIADLLEGSKKTDFNDTLAFPSGEGLAGQAFSSGKPMFLEDCSKDPLADVRGSVVRPKSLACLPLLKQGVLTISAYQSKNFTQQIKKNWELLGKVVSYFLLVMQSKEGFPCAAGEHPIRSMEKPAHPDSLLEMALEWNPNGICILDSSGAIIRYNKAVEELQGASSTQLIGRKPAVFFQDPPMFDQLFQRATQSRKVEVNEISLTNFKGEFYQADITVTQLPSQNGGLHEYLFVLNELSKKNARTRKIVQKEKLAALGTMAGGVAHDFNNLLMTILGNIQLVLPDLEDEEVKRRLESIEKAVHDGSHTVRRLQRFTGSERGNGGRVFVNVEEAIRDVVELTRPRWKNAMEKYGCQIDLKVDLQPDCMAAIHPSDLREVLTNMLFNAVEAMLDGGMITISCWSEDSIAIIQIADTGIGMSKGTTHRIFDPFYSTKGVGNSGLGLSVSWSLIARTGGDIHVKSKPGEGTIFTIRVPRAKVDKRKTMPESTQKENCVRKMLLVDDDRSILDIIRDMLRLKGHKVTATHDGAKALELIRDEDFDLVLTDLGMPGVNGWDVAKAVKEKDPRIPVVLITGWGAQYEEEDLSERGVDIVLSKPLSWEKLTTSVERIVQR